MPYRLTKPSLYCVDDPNSPSYNQWVQHKSKTQPTWQSAEDLFSIDVYDLAINVAYNEKRIAGNGSCIFIHRWHFQLESTLGCTVLSQESLKQLILWLDKEKNPLLIQLPLSHYKKLAQHISLPPIPSKVLKQLTTPSFKEK